MATLNLCQFIGNVGKIEPVRYMPDGKAVVNLSLAVNESYKDKSGNKVEQTEWIRVVAFGKLADIIAQYVLVGHPLYISGKIKTRKYQKDGQDHYSTEIVADQMQMLGAKTGESRPSNLAEQNRNAVFNENRGTPGGVADFSDDIPF